MRRLGRKEGGGVGSLGGGGKAVEDESPGEIDLVRRLGAGLGFESAREALGLVEQEPAVHQHQRLRGHGGLLAAFAVHLHHRCVEGVQQGERSRAPDLDVDGSPELLAMERDIDGHLVVALRLVDPDDDLAVDVGSDRNRRTELVGADRAADGEDRVTDRFGVEALERFVPVEAVLGIAGIPLAVVRRGLAVGGGSEDQAMESLQLPSVLHEIVGEPVEEFGMRRALAHGTEIRGRADEAAAEVMHPDAVHQHAGDERIRAAGEPPGEGQAPAGAGEFGILVRWAD